MKLKGETFLEVLQKRTRLTTTRVLFRNLPQWAQDAYNEAAQEYEKATATDLPADVDAFLAEVERRRTSFEATGNDPDWIVLDDVPALLGIIRKMAASIAAFREQQAQNLDGLRRSVLQEANAKHELSKALGREAELRERLATLESNGPPNLVEAYKALVVERKELLLSLATCEQTKGEACSICGWSMKFPDAPCRCELEKENDALRVRFAKLELTARDALNLLGPEYFDDGKPLAELGRLVNIKGDANG